MRENKGNEIRNMRFDSLEAALGSLLADYPDVMIFERNRNTATTVKLNDRILAVTERSEPRSYSETWNRYIGSYVIYEDRNELLMSVENETIYSKIQKDGIFTKDYRISFRGESIMMQVTFFDVHADRDYIVFGFRNITKVI